MAKKTESATPVPPPPGDTPINQELLAATEARIRDALGETPTGMESMEAPVPAAETPALQVLTDGADPGTDILPPAAVKKLVGAMRASPMISAALRRHLNGVYRRL